MLEENGSLGTACRDLLVSYQKDGPPVLVEHVQQIEHLLGIGGVKIAGRFVGQD